MNDVAISKSVDSTEEDISAVFGSEVSSQTVSPKTKNSQTKHNKIISSDYFFHYAVDFH